jgi:hypothetical protein
MTSHSMLVAASFLPGGSSCNEDEILVKFGEM